MSQTTIAPDVHQPLDVHLDLLAQIAFYPALLVDHRANAIDFLFGQLSNALIDAYARFSKYLVGARAPDAVYVRQTDFSSFVSWQVDTCDACLSSSDCFALEARWLVTTLASACASGWCKSPSPLRGGE